MVQWKSGNCFAEYKDAEKEREKSFANVCFFVLSLLIQEGLQFLSDV